MVIDRNMKSDFVAAYTWMYGETKKKAEGVYKRAMEIADYGYIREMIACFKDNAKRNFYSD